jgi:hypothetical protein
MKSAAGAILVLALAAGLYLLLIDTVDLPELYAGCAAVALAMAAFEAARRQGVADASVAPALLHRGWRALAGVPIQIVFLCTEAVAQLVSPRAQRGQFRAVSFDAGADNARDAGRRALAEGLGSFAPNTIVVGVDPERDLLLVHQLKRQGGRAALDVLELG